MNTQIDFVPANWTGRFLKIVGETPRAKESLDLIVANGMEQDTLLVSLYEYTDPNYVRHLQQTRKWLKEASKKMLKLEKAVAEIATQLESNLPDFQAAQSVWLSHGEQPVIDGLRAVSNSVQQLRKHYQKLSSGKGKGRDEERLVNLCLMVEATTGDWHWGDIASLLEIASEAHGRAKQWQEDAVRNVVARYRQRQPQAYEAARQFIRENLDALGGRDDLEPIITRSRRNRRVSKKKKRKPLLTKHSSTSESQREDIKFSDLSLFRR